MTRPSGVHVAPPDTNASAILTAGPPATGTFVSEDPRTKPSHRPSGEKNGVCASSVPGIGRASKASSARMYRLPPVRYTSVRPSGEMRGSASAPYNLFYPPAPATETRVILVGPLVLGVSHAPAAPPASTTPGAAHPPPRGTPASSARR